MENGDGGRYGNRVNDVEESESVCVCLCLCLCVCVFV